MKKFRYIFAAILTLAFISTLAWAGTAQIFKYGIRLYDEGVEHSTPPDRYGDIYVNGDTPYFITDGGVATSLLTGTAAWDDITDPDAAGTIAMTTYQQILTSTKTDGDMFLIQGLGAFGDVSVLRVEQKTGNATNGTVLEVISADTDVDALLVTANSVNVIKVNGAGTLSLTGATGLTGDLSITGDLAVSGSWTVNALAAATATQTLTLDGNSTGGVTIGATSTGNVILGDDVVVSDGYNMTVGEGSLTIDNDATDETALTITTDATTSGGGISIVSAATTTNGKAIKVVADAVTTGDLLYLESSATGMTTGNFINCYNGSATVFEVGLYGAAIITGNASTDVLTVTAGDIQLTAGDIDLDNGQLMVNTAQDLSNNITRDYAGAGTAAVLVVSDDNTASTNIALDINQDGTAGSTAVRIIHDGDSPAIDISAGVARTGNVIDISMTNQVAQNGIFIDGAWTGASDIGMINLNPTGSIAAGASCLFINTDTGTPGASGFGIEIDDDSVDGGTYYALLINSANNEGLHVEAGTSLFAEAVTFTAGIDSDGDVDIDLSANTEEVSIETTAVDFAAGSGLVQIHGDHAGNTNDMALLRLVYQADADAQDTFISCVDNSTGAAANGDVQFKVGTNGDITTAGTLTVNGAQIIGDGATEMVGVRHDVVDGGAGPTAVTAAMSGTVFYNSEATEFDLPADPTGLEFTFVVGNASNLHIDPNGTDQILHSTCAAGDRILSATVGDTVTLVGLDAGAWYVKAMYPAATDWTDAD